MIKTTHEPHLHQYRVRKSTPKAGRFIELTQSETGCQCGRHSNCESVTWIGMESRHFTVIAVLRERCFSVSTRFLVAFRSTWTN